jgi:ABC-type polysaccharide/polyol phosphate export permease
VIDVAEYGRFAPFFRNLVKREVRQKYKGSLFGLAWTLVTPALIVLSYWVVFTYVFKVDTIPNYALFLFAGLVVWTFFFGGVQMAASSIVGNANLVKKVRFPREIVPTAARCSPSPSPSA